VRTGKVRRVLLTLDAVGGVWQYGLDLAHGMAARGIESVLAHMGPPPSAAQLAEARRIANTTFIETGLPLDWLCEGPDPVREASAAIAALAADEKVDIVQLNMPTLGARTAFPAPMIAVTHGCVSTWWQAARPGEPLDPMFAWHRALMAQGLAAADRVVAPTASYAGTIARHYGLSRLPAVVHNGRRPLIDAGTHAMQDSVLMVGRLWDRVKRAALLDRVAARLAVPVLAAGALEGPHGERIAPDHLVPIGQLGLDALARRLASRPVFVSTASFEPFGLAVLEAAAAGCALVLSDIDSFRELWDGVAIFVAGEDEARWADAIEDVIGDMPTRLRLGAAARERAARLTPAAMAEGMAALYETAADSLPTGRAAA